MVSGRLRTRASPSRDEIVQGLELWYLIECGGVRYDGILQTPNLPC